MKQMHSGNKSPTAGTRFDFKGKNQNTSSKITSTFDHSHNVRTEQNKP